MLVCANLVTVLVIDRVTDTFVPELPLTVNGTKLKSTGADLSINVLPTLYRTISPNISPDVDVKGVLPYMFKAVLFSLAHEAWSGVHSAAIVLWQPPCHAHSSQASCKSHFCKDSIHCQVFVFVIEVSNTDCLYRIKFEYLIPNIY